MEETKQNVAKLAKWQKVEIIVISLMALSFAVNAILLVKNTRNCDTSITVDGLTRQNQHLMKNNEMLLGIVKALETSIGERNKRDSVTLARINANDARLENTINRRLTEIDKNYEKTRAAINAYNGAELRGYLSNNAARERRMGGQGRTPDADTQQRTRAKSDTD